MKTEQQIGKYVKKLGFRPLVKLVYGFPGIIYWSSDHQIELQVTDLSSSYYLVKAMKKYFIKGQSESGRETVNRDLSTLANYLDSHFPEAHLYCYFLRDLPSLLVPESEQITAKEEKLAQLKGQVEEKRSYLKQKRRVNQWLDKEFEEAGRYVNRDIDQGKKKLEALTRKGRQLEQEVLRGHKLLSEYRRLGRGTVLLFGVSTPLRLGTGENYPEVVDKTIDDIQKTHRSIIYQKLEGSKLQIYIEPVTHPSIAYSAEWVGLLSPNNIERIKDKLGPSAYRKLKSSIYPMFLATASQDIQVKGSKVDAKRTPAWAFRVFLNRKEDYKYTGFENLPAPERGAWIGNIIHKDKLTDLPYHLPFDELNHAYCSGVSGSGKSFLGRVIAEGAVLCHINLVIMDPRNQAATLMLPEDRPQILSAYKDFGLDPKEAQGFEVNYYRPAGGPGQRLPSQVAHLLNPDKPAVISFKGMGPKDRCHLFSDLMEDIFVYHEGREWEKLRTLVIIEEAQLFSRSGVRSDRGEVKEAAGRSEGIIDQFGREARKYGLNLLLLSQTITDFSYSAKTIRQNTNVKLFLRGSDTEIKYASDYLPEPQRLPKLATGEVMAYHPDYQTVRVKVRPPFSKVIELPDENIKRHLTPQGTGGKEPVGLEKEVLEAAISFYQENQDYPTLTQMANSLGMSVGASIKEAIDGLQDKELIKTENLKARGNPRVIIPLDK